MDGLPAALHEVFVPYRSIFTQTRVFCRAETLLAGALLCPGRRTVAAALRMVGRASSRAYSSYHRVLSQARWSSLQASRILLDQLLAAFVPAEEPIVLVIDETLERRRGPTIRTKGLYRDATRSSRSIHVLAWGLRWTCVMLLCHVPGSSRRWALPFLTLPSPSGTVRKRRGRPAKTEATALKPWITRLRRWLGTRTVILIGDNAYCVLELLVHAQAESICVVTRMRLDAALYALPPSAAEHRARHRRGRLPTRGAREATLAQRLTGTATAWTPLRWGRAGQEARALQMSSGVSVWSRHGAGTIPVRWVLLKDPTGHLEPMAVLSTDPSLSPEQIVAYYAERWAVEVTFEEARAHLGVETQRQWSARALGRTTPCLLGLVSLLALYAAQLGETILPRRSAWYDKTEPTLSDLLAHARRALWSQRLNSHSPRRPERRNIPNALLHPLLDALAYAA